MDKEELWGFAEKLGVKRSNFDFAWDKNKESLEGNIITGAKFMGFLKDDNKESPTVPVETGEEQ